MGTPIIVTFRGWGILYLKTLRKTGERIYNGKIVF